MARFVHLHCHSEYSLLEGVVSVGDLIQRCADMGMEAVALTDNGSMYGVIEFYLKAKAKGIKPIIGCEVYLTEDMSQKTKGLDRLVLLCQDFRGYQNLIGLVSLAHLEGFYYKPRLDLKAFEGRTEGLVAISPGYNGPVASGFRFHDSEKAEKNALALKALFGDRFYLGLQKQELPFEELVIEGTMGLSKAHGIPLVAANDTYYLEPEDSTLKNVLRCIQTGKKLEDDLRVKFQTNDMSFRSPEAMADAFKDCPEAIENTIKIAESCNLKLEMEQVKLPHFECPGGLSAEA